MLVGVGDQLDAAGNLRAYEDFGTADFALMVGPPPEDQPFGQATYVPPDCTYSSAGAAAAEVAAHAAAALALSSHVARNYSGASATQVPDWLFKAQELLAYSVAVSPVDKPGVGTDFKQKLGVRDVLHLLDASLRCVRFSGSCPRVNTAWTPVPSSTSTVASSHPCHACVPHIH